MNKFIKISSLAIALLFAGNAMAASITNIKFDNGQTTTSCTAGQSVNVTFRVNVPAGEVAELGQVEVLGDSIAPALPVSLGGELGLQEGPHDVATMVTCPQNTGYYTVEYRTAGIFLGQRAIAMTDGVTSVASFSSALRVVANGTGDTSVGGTMPTWFETMMAQLLAVLKPAPVVTPPAPANTACTEFATLSAGLYEGSDTRVGGRVGQLQSFLMGKGFSIPLLYAQKVPYGFYGSQTASAVVAFRDANKCI